MITWIQRYFQHHFKTVFAVLLVLIIISFVFITNASGGFNRADRHIADRPFFGYNLSHPDDQTKIAGDAQLSVSLQIGFMGGVSPEQIQNYAFNRAASLYLADQWHIPQSTNAELEEAIKKLRVFAGPDGTFDANQYQTFRTNLKAQVGIRESDIARVVKDDVRADKVQKLLGGPGYVLANDIKQELAQADTSWTLGIASADLGTFAPDIKPTEADLTKAFEDAGARYDIPPRVVVSYLGFGAESYVGQITFTEAEVRSHYDMNPMRFPKPATTAGAPAIPAVPDPNADFNAVRPQVETALRLERARALAAKAASDFAVGIYNAQAMSNAASLDAYLARQKLTPKALPPFTQEAPPAELGGSPEVAEQAFSLNATKLVSDAINTPNGAAVLFWKETLPAHKPLFSEVREKVSADYIANEKQKRFVDAGRTVKTQLEARLKAGDTLEQAATAAASSSGLKIEAKSLPAFTLRTPPQDLDYNAMGALSHLQQGEVSDMVVTPDKGLFIYAKEKKLPDISETSPAYIEARTQLATRVAQVGGSSYVAELVDRELKKSEPKVQ